MPQPVVVGVDGSECSLTAVDWAADEAARHGRPLRLVYAWFWEQYEILAPAGALERPEGGTAADGVLAAAGERVSRRQPSLDVSVNAATSPPVPTLVEEGGNAFLLVVGSRGRGPLTSLFLGSVGLGVAGRAPCPTVVVRGAPQALNEGFGRVVLGVSGSEHEASATEFAVREAAARACELRAVHAWRRSPQDASHPDGEARAETVLAGALADALAAHPDVEARHEAREGAPREVLLRAAQTADLLVVGAHRRTGHHGLGLGLAGHALVHHAPCPVAVVPRQ
ncbi:universal stress protein [Streptomyces hoynatensis]|uniref:Universal stress protein n=1 Tax=Streptomyces hoynatensis TaxID=1141874 RepID=A0A3A9Z9Y8_9ACTN|nr:universal stress protein [Streptomyces hoynatensis]RKN45073.1 universal stress protein [Streptomyces hoynatensis]